MSHQIRADDLRFAEQILVLATATGSRGYKRLVAAIDLDDEFITYDVFAEWEARPVHFALLDDAVDSYNAIDEG